MNKKIPNSIATLDMRFPATYSRMIARELKLKEIAVQSLLSGSDLSPEDLFQLDRKISAYDQYTLIRNGLLLSGNPAFGLQLGSRMPLAAHGTLGAAVVSAPNLRTAFATSLRFQGLRAQFIKMLYKDENGFFIVELELQVPFDEVGLFLIEATMATNQWMIEFILGRALTEAKIEFVYKNPPHADSYENYLHSTVSFGCNSTRLIIPGELLDAPNPFGDPDAYANAIFQCERQELSLRPQESWQARVTSLLQLHPGQLWTLPEVAAALHLSSRSLIRRLHAENTRYQFILDEELHRQALMHFEIPQHTVTSVAAALGYKDVKSFRRAFKRWTGISPQEWLAVRGKKSNHANTANLAVSAPI